MLSTIKKAIKCGKLSSSKNKKYPVLGIFLMCPLGKFVEGD
jgi:hypothetical protein